jgi:glycosyltransferase involved in cell wall biosynthesis
MLQVDVLKSGSLKSPIGPTGTLRRLKRDEDYVKERGYELKIFSADSFCNTGNSNSTKNNNNANKRLKNNIKSFVTKNRLLSILFTIRTMHHARRLVYNYKKLNRKPDIIVFHDFFVYDQFVRLVDNDAKKVLFFHSDGLKFEMLYKNFPKLRTSLFAKHLERRFDKAVEKLDKIVFIAKIGQKNFLSTNPHIDPAKTTFFHNGIDDLIDEQKNEPIKIPDHKKFKYRLICTGTISERKGQYLIIKALSKINRDILKDIHLTLLGSGSQLAYLEEFVNKNNLSRHVSFEGSVDNSIVYKYLKQANIYILMSNNEGLPISIIEAMRSSLPIISTNIAGIPELVRNNFNGVLLDPDETQLINLLNTIKQYNWEEMGNNSRSRFENEFTFGQMKQAYCDMLDSLYTK